MLLQVRGQEEDSPLGDAAVAPPLGLPLPLLEGALGVLPPLLEVALPPLGLVLPPPVGLTPEEDNEEEPDRDDEGEGEEDKG